MNKIILSLTNSRINQIRYFKNSTKQFQEKNVSKSSTTPQTTPPSSTAEVDSNINKRFITPNGLDKFVLVWTKKYKSKEEIPNLVPSHIYNHARNVARIKFANITIVLILFGCVFAVYKGKKDAREGNTLLKQAREFHEEIRQEQLREENERAKQIK